MVRRHGWYWTRFVVLTAAPRGPRRGLRRSSAPRGGSSLVAAALAVVLGQVMFLGHDAAHRQIFASGTWNEWASLVIANLYAGMSYGWWQHKHSRHHAKPNQVGADPDIGTGALVFHTEELHEARAPASSPGSAPARAGCSSRCCCSRASTCTSRASRRSSAAARSSAARSRSRFVTAAPGQLPRPGVLGAAGRHGVRVPRRPARAVRPVHGCGVRARTTRACRSSPRTPRSTSCAARCS